jgi:hypothetical protein
VNPVLVETIYAENAEFSVPGMACVPLLSQVLVVLHIEGNGKWNKNNRSHFVPASHAAFWWGEMPNGNGQQGAWPWAACAGCVPQQLLPGAAFLQL